MLRKMVILAALTIGVSGCGAQSDNANDTTQQEVDPTETAGSTESPAQEPSPTGEAPEPTDEPAASTPEPTDEPASPSDDTSFEPQALINVTGIAAPTLEPKLADFLDELPFDTDPTKDWVKYGGPNDLPMVVIENGRLMYVAFVRGNWSSANYSYFIAVDDGSSPESVARSIATAILEHYPTYTEETNQDEQAGVKTFTIDLMGRIGQSTVSVSVEIADNVPTVALIDIEQWFLPVEPVSGADVIARGFSNQIETSLQTVDTPVENVVTQQIAAGLLESDPGQTEMISLDIDFEEENFAGVTGRLKALPGATVTEETNELLILEFTDDALLYTITELKDGTTTGELDIQSPEPN